MTNKQQQALELIASLTKLLESDLSDESPLIQLANIMETNNLSISIRKAGGIRISKHNQVLVTLGDHFYGSEIINRMNDENQ